MAPLRAPHLLAIVALLALAAPAAAAATFELGAERIVERALQPGSEAVFEMPLAIHQDGFLYAKVLPTEGNAVNDGFRANGSVGEGKGWIVKLAFESADGERKEMGSFVDSTQTALFPVKRGDAPTFITTVRIPADAAIGGPRQAVYVAIAYRPSATTGVGASSGASMDEARALTLLMTNALLPPASATTPPAPSGSDAPSTPAPDEEAADAEAQVPPVAPVAPLPTSGTTRVTIDNTMPAWFLAGILVVGGALAAALLLIGIALARIGRALEARAPAPPERAASVNVPVVGKSAREEPTASARARE